MSHHRGQTQPLGLETISCSVPYGQVAAVAESSTRRFATIVPMPDKPRVRHPLPDA